MYDVGLADRLRRWGVPVVECDGWQHRGRANFSPEGAVDHHTAGGPNGVAPSLNAVIYGFAGSAPGPLANVLQSREQGEGNDRAFVVAAGTANHAGYGGWRGLSGNSSVWGLEVEHVGTEDLPQHRQHTAQLITAAFVDGTTDGGMTCQHFEWSGYGDGSKIDIATGIDANDWRRRITEILQGGSEEPDMDKNEHEWLQNLHEKLVNQPFFLDAHYQDHEHMDTWVQNLHEKLINQPHFLDAQYATKTEVSAIDAKIDAIMEKLGIEK